MYISDITVASNLSEQTVDKFAHLRTTQQEQSASITEYDNLFVSTNERSLNEILAPTHRIYIVASNPDQLIDLLENTEVPKNHLFTIIIESRNAFSSKVAKDIEQYLLSQNIFDKTQSGQFRFLLHESIVNAIEHGHIRIDKNDHINEADWFDKYYTELERRLQETDDGLQPVIIQCALHGNYLDTWVEDQGQGFDTDDRKPLDEADLPHGMGTGLMEIMAEEISYDLGGRRIFFRVKTKDTSNKDSVDSNEPENTEVSKTSEPTVDLEPDFSTFNRSPIAIANNMTLEEIRAVGRILLVDDQVTNRELAFYFLKSAGYVHIDQAGSGEEAIEKVSSFKPDLILLDIIMPGMTGFDVCAKLKENPATSKIPILFLSGLTDAQSRTKGYSLGAVDYVNKPINREEMVARTDVHINNGILLSSLENYTQRVSEDLERARKFQINLLPSEEDCTEIGDQHNILINSHFEASDELAGDYWTIFNVNENYLCFILADFTGHGVVASLNTVRLHALCYEFEKLLHEPLHFVNSLNDRLYQLLPIEHFSTFYYGLLNSKTGDLTYISCGAPPMAVIPSNSDIEPTLSNDSGLPLGLVPSTDLNLEVKQAHIDEGDTLLLYSDALIESELNDGTRWMEDGFMKVLHNTHQKTPDCRMSYILDIFRENVKSPIKDDLTLLAITRK